MILTRTRDLPLRTRDIILRINKTNKSLGTDCSPEDGPHGLHVLSCGSCGPARVDDAAEQDDEYADPYGPRQNVARPGK